MTLPLCHSNQLELLTQLVLPPDWQIQDETPLMGSDYEFAMANGGQITRAFLESLPLEVSEPLIVDTSLVWLVPGLAHGFEVGPAGKLRRPRSPVRFTHEAFPGVASGVRGASNRNQDVKHWLCVLGLDCTPEMVYGDWRFDTQSEADQFWLPLETLEPREDEIERRLGEGSLRSQQLPVGTIVQFGWGTFLRFPPAERSGFQLVLRATQGDPRPAMNGRRNLAML